MLQHPRFSSVMVRDHRGIEHWRPTKIDIDRHLLVIHNPLPTFSSDDHQSAICDYLSDLSTSSTLSMDKPLWEMHILIPHKCVIFRIHHSLGDGISLMSMLLASCRKLQDPHSLPTISLPTKPPTNFFIRFYNLLVSLFYSFIYFLQFILRCLWIRDRKTAISGGSGVELWPRKMATATFALNDMKTVKAAVPNAVIFSFISFPPFFYQFMRYRYLNYTFQIILNRLPLNSQRLSKLILNFIQKYTQHKCKKQDNFMLLTNYSQLNYSVRVS